jgi:hypothetical protein
MPHRQPAIVSDEDEALSANLPQLSPNERRRWGGRALRWRFTNRKLKGRLRLPAILR